jgi:hypothetical protein
VHRLPIPADQQAEAIHTAQQAGGTGALGSLRGEGSGIADAVARAFGHGLHTAYLVAAVFAALTLVVGLLTFRRPGGTGARTPT